MSTASDLEYVLGKLDREHVAELVVKARVTWDLTSAEAFELTYMPGDGTHYALVFTIVRDSFEVYTAEGGGTGAGQGIPARLHSGLGIGTAFDGSYAILYYAQRGRAAVIGRHDYTSIDWIQETYDCSWGSAVALAVLLNEITGGGPGWQERMVENYREAEAAA